MEQGMWQKRLSRRAMIGGIAGSAAAAILAACGGSKATDTPASKATTAPTTGATTSAGTVAAPTAPAATTSASSAVTGTTAVGTTASSTTAAGTSTTGTTATAGNAFSPVGTKSPNFASTQALRVVLAGDPKTLDPAIAQFNADVGLIHILYDDLLTFDDKGGLVPRAAMEVPTQQNGGISSDGKTYTVKLRPGQKFSDGSPVTAKDYVYAIKRFISPVTASNYASFVSDIAGYKELYLPENVKKSAQELQPLLDKIGVAAKDDNTLVVTLANVQPVFAQILALWGLAPLKQSVIEKGGADWWKDPKNHVTNGAWVLDSFTSNQSLVFKPNPNYTGSEKPYLTEVQMKIIKDPAQIWNAYQNNEIDMVSVPTANRQQVLSDSSFKDQIFRKPNLTTFALSFNSKVAPFDKAPVRKAFATAIDRDAFVRDVLKGVGKPTTTWVAPGEPGYNADIGVQYKFDAAKAKKTLSDASIDPKSISVKITHTNAGDGPIIAQFFQAQLRQNLGVETQLDPQEPKIYAKLVADDKNYQMTTGGWNADYPDPQNWLPELFGTSGGNNSYNYSNPKVDDLFKQAAAEQDNTKRLALYAQAEKIIIDDDAAIGPLYNSETFYVHKTNLMIPVTTPMDSAFIGTQHAFAGFQFIKK
ncbi:MAG: peptide ABC transporter substrate-binding protein [Chloroflexota bacterium]|nr:peptide ABC transporter substrate-binding protein [Chloroflexota bacterium]MDQ6906993.1 peptide ABC transporter substrate-binding protein [Chloroflexota bacterium]